MDMTLRWYGPGYDSVTLKQIRQIPGVKNVKIGRASCRERV